MYPRRDDIIYHEDPAAAVQTDEGPGAVYEPYAKRGKLQIKTIFALLKCPFTAALHSLKRLWRGLPFMRPEQTPFYDLLQSKAEQMSIHIFIII